jgi:hypothetical protein
MECISLNGQPVNRRSLSMEKTSVGILIFENVEVLDFAGPFEVFSRTWSRDGRTMMRRSKSSP